MGERNEEFAKSDAKPDGQGDILHACEACGNLIYIRKSEIKSVLPCPICGCLNSPVNAGDEERIAGRVRLIGPQLQARKDSDSGRVVLPEFPMEVERALMELMRHNWQVRFLADEDNEDGDGP
ncbi:MAG: hypothetical protein HQL31_13250 [Planctomycetes bacterium]|nr:hypothetical protein [Planctomycetota bacterium]